MSTENEKNPIMNDKELKDEALEQVTGGVGEEAATAMSAVNFAVPGVAASVPASLMAGAAVVVGGAWAIIDHQQPGKTYGHEEMAPTPTLPPTPSQPENSGGTPKPSDSPRWM